MYLHITKIDFKLTNNNYTIRELQLKGNEQIAKVIHKILIEFYMSKVGTTYKDRALNCVFKTYNIPKDQFFTIEKEVVFLDEFGIMKLQNCNENIYELQKTYLVSNARGKDLSTQNYTLNLALNP